jgi:hypothetical protein
VLGIVLGGVAGLVTYFTYGSINQLKTQTETSIITIQKKAIESTNESDSLIRAN